MPDSAIEISEAAIDALAATVILQEVDGGTRQTSIVATASTARPGYLGRYLLGVPAGAVQTDARLSEKYMKRARGAA